LAEIFAERVAVVPGKDKNYNSQWLLSQNYNIASGGDGNCLDQQILHQRTLTICELTVPIWPLDMTQLRM